MKPKNLSSPKPHASSGTTGLLRTTCVMRLLLLVLLMLPAVVQAQFDYTTQNGTITITGYTGPGGAVAIPATINGLPVTSIGGYAFRNRTSLTSITVPSSITNIGSWAFEGCTGLVTMTIGSGVTSMGDIVCSRCTSLTAITVDADNSIYGSVDGVLVNKSQTTLIRFPQGKTGNYTIPSSVTSIGSWAFQYCTGLTGVTIPSNVTSIRENAFSDFISLKGVYFLGRAPRFGSGILGGDSTATVYYLPGTAGWGPTFGGRPTAPWLLPNPLILNNGSRFGVRTNQFGFVISWATNASVVVEASADLAQPIWTPVGTNTLTDGSSYFSDPQWMNYPARFYRLRSP